MGNLRTKVPLILTLLVVFLQLLLVKAEVKYRGNFTFQITAYENSDRRKAGVRKCNDRKDNPCHVYFKAKVYSMQEFGYMQRYGSYVTPAVPMEKERNVIWTFKDSRFRFQHRIPSYETGRTLVLYFTFWGKNNSPDGKDAPLGNYTDQDYDVEFRFLRLKEGKYQHFSKEKNNKILFVDVELVCEPGWEGAWCKDKKATTTTTTTTTTRPTTTKKPPAASTAIAMKAPAPEAQAIEERAPEATTEKAMKERAPEATTEKAMEERAPEATTEKAIKTPAPEATTAKAMKGRAPEATDFKVIEGNEGTDSEVKHSSKKKKRRDSI